MNRAAMAKGAGKTPFFSLLKAFNATGASEVSSTSEIGTLTKLLPKPIVSSLTPVSTSSNLMKSPKRSLSCLADRFVLQLNKASASNALESHVSVQDSCADVTREILSIIPSSDDTGLLISLSNFTEPYSNQHLNAFDWKKKEASRFRKQKALQNNTNSSQFLKLMKLCVDKLDVESTLGVFDRVGREISVKEYTMLSRLWIEKARETNSEASIGYIHKVHRLFISMKERGFQILDDCYGPVLIYLIEMRMKEEFKVLTEFIKDYDHNSCNKIGYYEMLLWIKLGDEYKIKELCNSIVDDECHANGRLAESYLLALCESDMEEELVWLLEVFSVENISSLKHASCIFKSIGRLQLEKFVEIFILAFKARGAEEGNISSFIYDYASNLPNLAVEDIFSKFEMLHKKVEVIPTIASWDKLIEHSCNLSKVQVSLDIADRMCQSGVAVSIESFHPILHACDRTSKFDMVHQIYSVIRKYNLKPNGDTFKSLIILCVKMKDFVGAYSFFEDARELMVLPTAAMYNALMAGYFREKNNYGVLKVLQQMKDWDIKLDSETYSYLISNCGAEDDIVKYQDEMLQTGVQSNKYVHMALINAYAKFGKFKKAKQVIREAVVPSRHLNEIRSVLVSALCSNGQISDALLEYDEIKQAGDKLEPKAAISLIEHLQSEGNLDRLRELLDELINSRYWFDGCSRVALYCVRHNLARDAVELLEKLKKKDESSTYSVIDQLFSDIWSTEPTNLEIGLELLRAIKEELHLRVSRVSLDFLLSICVKAKDPVGAQLVWSEYKYASLPYNILTFLRMYQALLASGDHKAASSILKGITQNDPHVRYIIECCKAAYGKKDSSKKKKA